MNKWFVYLVLACSLVINLLLIALSVQTGGFTALANKAQSVFTHSGKSGPPLYLHRENLFESLPSANNAIIFLGDSLTQYNEWHEQFGDARIVNRGISGDTTIGLLNRLDTILKSRPSKMFLMIGVNDLGAGQSLESIAQNHKMILEKITKESPNTKLYIESCLPVNNQLFGNKVKNTDVEKLNQNLRLLAESSDSTYIDLYNRMLQDGQLNKSYTADGIHLNGDGYTLWVKEIRQYIN